MAFSALLSLCLLASSVLATPVQIRSSPINLPLSLKINSTGGGHALVNRDRERGRALFAHGQAKAKGQKLPGVPVPLTNALTIYTAAVGVGNGTYTLIVDTGSSNTWVGAKAPYLPGPNSHDTGETVSVSYGSGFFSGEEFTDDVKVGPATIKSQSIGVASTSFGIDFDGILGIGPVGLTVGTTSGGESIPTVTDNLFSQHAIDANLVGVSFVPTTAQHQVSGELDFGATNPSQFTGKISFVPVTGTNPASEFWGVDQSITYGSNGTSILSVTAGIVDTGTTLTLLASEAFQAYQKATGAKLDQATGLLTVADPSTLKSLFFHVGGTTFELTANAQLWPRQFNTQIGGVPGQAYLIVADLGSPIGHGLDFINGFTFLQRFYSVYDTTNSQVGLAATSHTHDTTN